MSEGVPEWAKKEYIEQSKRKLICSMTIEDGQEKIGSVYFGSDVEGAEGLEDGRIRLTHSAGPAAEVEPHLRRHQYNIDMAKAWDAYPDKDKKRAFPSWIADQLNSDSAGDWAEFEILDPELAPEECSANLSLFEIHVDGSGNVQMLHPSRGTAVKFDTDKQTVSVLRAAIAHVGGESDPNEANKKFYAFVEKLLPSSEILEKMRKPEEIAFP